MVTSYREAPLLFLTTSSSYAPTGRNARAQARSASAKQTNPARASYGSFSSFMVEAAKHPSRTPDDEERPQKRRKTAVAKRTDNHPNRNAATLQTPTACPPLIPLRILATHFQSGTSPLPPNVNFDDVLKVAAFHIRRRAAQMINSNPDRILEALRCRQWCSASASQASLGRSLYLDNAIACVVSKVQQVVSGVSSSERMLLCYTEALHSLRDALQQPDLHSRVDMLSATHLLAIYEMLDFPNNASWTRHVEGAAALVKLPGVAHLDNAELSMHAGPMFVEALLSNDIAFLESKHWRSIINILAVKRGQNLTSGCESLECFTSLRSVFADSHAAISSTTKLSWAVRMPLLSRAHELRFAMRALILRSEKEIVKARQNAKGFDVLGLYLVSFIMLDKLILTLRQDIVPRGFDLQEDTQGLCNQMVRFELAASDANPGKEVLQALKRQARYPSLFYNA